MTNLSMRITAVALGLLAGVALVGGAQAADSVRLRGTITSFSGSTLEVKTREGEDKTVTLADGWKVSSVAAADPTKIKAGDFVGAASLPNADGTDGALEVLVFPAGMGGGAGVSFPWDLKPGSTMTNAPVADAVASVNGPTITLNYEGGSKTISIPEGTPVVTFAPATPADLVAGATVFVPADVAADGTISTKNVVVGTNGVVPPM